ncbi:DUF2147 domain-containing protein [Spirosoma areae]
MKTNPQITRLLLGAALLFTTSLSFGQSADAILGNWMSEKKDAKIEIYKSSNGKYYGKLFWGARMYEADGKTPRLAKNGKPFKDMVILKDFSYDDGTWEQGTIYDPEEDKTYSCKIKKKGNNLDIRGYVGMSLFGRTTVWQKI